MRIVIQRVREASVTIGGQRKSHIGRGLLVLLGIEDRDSGDDVEWLCKKLVNLRIFDDAGGVMNKSLLEMRQTAHDDNTQPSDNTYNILLVSQFTLMASTKKGNRPSYIRASRPNFAIPLYEQFIAHLASLTGQAPATGTFGADMQVGLVNDGPVTIIMDSHERDF